MARRIALIGGSLVAVAVCAILALVWAWRTLNAPLQIPADGMVYDVRPGVALTAVTHELHERGIVRHPRLIDWYARFAEKATAIQAGEYAITAGTSSVGLLDQLVSGDVLLHQFTIVEGWRVSELLTRLRSHSAIAAGNLTAAEVMASLGKPDTHPEGQFLPDTYSFPRGTRDTELLGWAHAALESVLEQAWSRRSERSVMSTAYDGLILASIIEKETALATERPLISGVLQRRLAIRMPLQTDPTVIYGLGDDFDGDLTRRHLQTDTPYNTYTRFGLPPTPIALAGEAAIRAAFDPAETDALYFVATGEPDGSHAFSATLEEHNAAVRRYLDRTSSD